MAVAQGAGGGLAGAAAGGAPPMGGGVGGSGATAVGFTVTPGRNFTWPSITTFSPAESPDWTSVSGAPALADDTLIGRISIVLSGLTT